MRERQELYCHDCSGYVQFDIDLAMDGNHVLKCPECGHEHCRVVKDGVITDIRWDQRNGDTIQVYVTTTSWSVTSTSSSSSSGTYLTSSWVTADTGTGDGYI